MQQNSDPNDNPNLNKITNQIIAENQSVITVNELKELKSSSTNERRHRLQTQDKGSKLIEKFLVGISMVLVVLLFPFSFICVFFVVRQFERAVILRNGKLYQNRVFGPGLVFFLPCVDIVRYTDLRVISYSVPQQEALTKDSLTVSVDAVVFYKVSNPILAVLNVADYNVATQFLAATALRNALGTRKLSELLSNRSSVSQQVFVLIKHLTKDWGIHVVRVEIKDISLPLQLQKAMAAEAESSRLANAKIIVAKAEIEATKSLQKATEILLDNPLAMKLRYLQSISMLSGDKCHTIVIPYSSDILKSIFQR